MIQVRLIPLSRAVTRLFESAVEDDYFRESGGRYMLMVYLGTIAISVFPGYVDSLLQVQIRSDVEHELPNMTTPPKPDSANLGPELPQTASPPPHPTAL